MMFLVHPSLKLLKPYHRLAVWLVALGRSRKEQGNAYRTFAARTYTVPPSITPSPSLNRRQSKHTTAREQTVVEPSSDS
jgi:hypothetical protein